MRNPRVILKKSLSTLLLFLTMFMTMGLEIGPEGSEFAIADWILISNFVFFLAALTVFLLALKGGMFKDVEDSKYYILNIYEEDYYTPDWAEEDEDVSGSDGNPER